MRIIKFIFPALALLILNGCVVTRTETPKSETPETNSSAESVAEAVAAAEGAAVTSSTPQAAAPDALVKDLYSVHGKDYSKIMNGKSRVLLDKYFDKNLANLIWKDLTTHKNEVGVIDFDIFYNAQDVQIKNLAVRPAKIENNRAEVVANFTNYDQKETVTYLLKQQNDAWKISDIKYGSGDTLLKYFKENANAENNTASTSSTDGEFEGTYQVGETTCTVKPIKMAFEVKWAKGTGSEIFYFENQERGQYIYMTEAASGGKVNIFALNEGFNSGEFIRGDGKRFPVKKIK